MHQIAELEKKRLAAVEVQQLIVHSSRFLTAAVWCIILQS